MTRLAMIALALLQGCSHEVERTALEIHALPNTNAVVLWREGRAEYLERVDAVGKAAWVAPVEGETLQGALTVRGHRLVVVQYRKYAAPELYELFAEAISSIDGRRLWRIPLGLYGEVPTGASLTSHLDAPTIDLLLHTARSDELIRLDPQSGVARARLWAGHVTATQHIRGSAIFHGNGTVVVGDDHVVRVAKDAWHGCVIGDSYVHVKLPDQLVWWHGGDTREQSRRRIALAPGWTSEGCFSYRGKVVLIGGFREATLSIVDGDQQAQVPLGGRLWGSTAFHEALEGSNRHGHATRFVPFVVRDEDDLTHVVLVDLERRRVVWRKHSSTSRTVHRVGSRWYLLGEPTRLTVIDGDTAATSTTRLSGAAIVPASAIGADVIWIPARDAACFGVVDAVTLRPRFLPPTILVDPDSVSEL